MPRVLNQRTATAEEIRNAVYVGRPSKWGNPFMMPTHGDRAEVIKRHREWLTDVGDEDWGDDVNPLMNQLGELRGKDLVCWCAPLPCHADTLLELANEKEEIGEEA